MTPMSPSVWQRVRRSITVGLFGVATVVGVGIGLQGASVSPVAPAVAAGPIAPASPASPAPARVGVPVGHGRRGHR